MIDTLNWVAAGLALLAAAFWLASAIVPVPKVITSGYGGSGGTMQTLGEAVRRQSRRSAAGAACAALAALAQSLALALGAIGP